MKKILRVVASIMLTIAICFVIYALNHPESSFPWSNLITYVLYIVYFVAMTIMFVLSFIK